MSLSTGGQATPRRPKTANHLSAHPVPWLPGLPLIEQPVRVQAMVLGGGEDV